MSAAASILAGSTPNRAGKRRQAVGLARSLFQLHERIMSRPTTRLAGRLEESQWWSARRHAENQTEKLDALLAHAVAHCPFYSARRNEYRGSIGTLDGLHQLPLLTRRTLRLFYEEMRSQQSALPLIGHTHGNSDEPVRFYWDRMRQAWDKAQRLRGHAWHGFEIGDRELHLWPIDPPASTRAAIKQALRSARDWLTGDRQIDVLNSRFMEATEIGRRWNAFSPARLTAYPSILAEVLGRTGLRLAKPRTVFLTGEVTFDWQRRLVESVLSAATVQNYGLQEVGPVAFECERGSWHVCAESVVIEYICRGRAAQAGELAEIVVTGLQSRAMPMIRYCTGDIVRAAARRDCSCGRGLPVMPPVLGRAGDFLLSAEGRWIGPGEVIEHVGRWIEPGSFQVVQSATGNLAVSIRASAQISPEIRRGLEGELQGLLGEIHSCQITQTNTLERTRFGKCRYVQSVRTIGGLAEPRQREDDDRAI